MGYYWRLKKKDYYFTAIELKKLLPELKETYTETIESRLRGSGLQFYKTESVKTKILVRLTLPFGLITMGVLLLFLPIQYIITGYWGYKWAWLKNWLSQLGF